LSSSKVVSTRTRVCDDRICEMPPVAGRCGLQTPASSQVRRHFLWNQRRTQRNPSVVPGYVFDPDGAPVTVSGYGSELTYHVGEYTGRAVATFSAASPGDYRVLIEGDAPPEATLAVGESFGGSLGALIGAGVLLFVTLGAAVALVAITASRRRKSSASPGPALTHAPPPTVRVPSSH
jgi:hypothetical protein